MTTLAYKDGVLAYDSRITSEDVIISDSFKKGLKTKKFIAAICGDCAEGIRFLDFLKRDLGDEGSYSPNSDELGCLVVDKDGNFFEYFSEAGSLQFIPYGKIKTFAAGSGRDFALAAMECGKSAEDAVRVAIKFDKSSGGKINKLTIKELK